MTNLLGTPPTQSSLTGSSNSYIEQGATIVSPQEYTQQYPMSLSASDGTSSVTFPGIIFREEASNALAIHTYPNQPNARVENMGQNPTKYHVRAALNNNISPGFNEQWKRGTLFPANSNLNNTYSVFDMLRILLSQPGNKIFQHPWDGAVTVQVETWSYDMSGDKMRSGVLFDINFITTIADDVPLSQTLLPARAAGITTAANNVEAQLLAILFGASGYAAYNIPGMNLTGLFNSIAATITSSISIPTLPVNPIGLDLSIPGMSTTVGGNLSTTPSFLVNNTLNNLQSNQSVLGTQQSLTASTSSAFYAVQAITALNNQPAQNISQFLQNTQRALTNLTQFYIDQNASAASSMIEALKQMNYQVLQQIISLNNSNTPNLRVSSFVTNRPTSFMSIAQLYQNSIDNILELNPTLITRPFAEANQTVYYYAS